MGRAADALREERRRVLGTAVAVCLRCGAARRYFEEFESELPARCSACDGELLRRCPACTAPLLSAFSVDCDACGARLREPTLAGMPIRREPR